MRSVLSIFLAGVMLGTFHSGCSASPVRRPTRPGEQVAQASAPQPAALVAKVGTVKKSSAPAMPKAPVVSAQSVASRHGLKFTWIETGKRFVMKSPAWNLEFEVDSRECSINGDRVFLGEGVRLAKGEPVFSKIDADKLLAPVLRPGLGAGEVPKLRTIVLDPGHGGSDSGMVNAKLALQEKVLALDTAMRLKKLLERDGYRVVMTRTDDRYVALPDRPEVADKVEADLFVSVHFNSVKNSAETVTGVEVYTMAPQNQLSSDMEPDPVYAPKANPGNVNDHWNVVLGHAIHHELLDELKVPDRGMKRSRFAVLRLSTCPAVLIESGYLSNDAEARKLANAKYRQRIAEGIAAGISRYATRLEAARKK